MVTLAIRSELSGEADQDRYCCRNECDADRQPAWHPWNEQEKHEASQEEREAVGEERHSGGF
jgi:hypothetical protein